MTTPGKIFCVGDLIVDVWWFADTLTRNAEHAAMALISRPEDREVTPGGVGIVATALAAMKQHAAVLSTADTALTTDLAIQRLNVFGVETHPIRYSRSLVTPVKTRYVNVNNHILMRHDSENPVTRSHESYTHDYFQACVKDFDCVAVSDYDKGGIPWNVRDGLVSLAQLADKPIYVDTKPAHFTKYAAADVFKINMHEFRSFAAAELRAASLEVAIQRVAVQLKTPLLIVTDGGAGAYYCHNYGTTCFMPALMRHVAGNCVGAGDVFFAGILFGFATLGEYRPAALSEDAVFKLLQFGLATAGAYVALGGRQFPTAAAVLNDVHRPNLPIRRIMSPIELIQFAKEQRQFGHKIVLTNGCFDLLHSGHIALLTAAKQEGDILLVGVDSDANVARLKGAGRPVQDEATRAGNIAALDVVDAVCVFTDSDANLMLEYLISEVQPDVLVKGADYEDKTIVGADFLRRQNPPGRVVLVPLIPNSSTTSFVNKIKAVTP